MTAGFFGSDKDDFAPQRKTSAQSDLTAYLMHGIPHEALFNPAEIIRKTLHDSFGFNVIANDQLQQDEGYRLNLIDTLENCIFIVVLLEGINPVLSFEYGISVSMQKPLIVMRGRSAIAGGSGNNKDDEILISDKKERMKYLANLPGLTDDQIIHYTSGDADELIRRLVREMALHREAISTEIHRAGQDIPVQLYIQFLNFLKGEDRKRILEEAMDHFPDNKDLYIMAGRIKLSENDLFSAARHFERAVELSPDDTDAYMQKGGAYYDLGQFETAAEDWDEAIKLQPINPHAYYNKGNAVFYLDREDEASRSFITAYEQKPGFVNALNNQASIQITRRNYRKAAELLEEATRRQPSYAFSWFNLARAYRGMGRPNNIVIENLKKAARAARSNLMMGHDIKRNTYCLFLVYAALGNRDEALAHLRKCSNYDMPLKSWRIADRITNETILNDPEFQALIATAR